MQGLGARWLGAWRRRRGLRRLRDPAYRFLFAPPPPREWVALDCETTGLDPRRDEIIAVAAVRIVDHRILSSQRLQLLVRPRGEPGDSARVHRLRGRDLANGLPVREALDRLLRFVGSRPLVGYYLEFDVAMIERELRPWLGIGLPQQRIEVSALYHDHKLRQLPDWARQGNVRIDLRLQSMMRDLDLPSRDAHDPFNDAEMAAMAFLKLRELNARGAFSSGPSAAQQMHHQAYHEADDRDEKNQLRDSHRSRCDSEEPEHRGHQRHD